MTIDLELQELMLAATCAVARLESGDYAAKRERAKLISAELDTLEGDLRSAEAEAIKAQQAVREHCAARSQEAFTLDEEVAIPRFLDPGPAPSDEFSSAKITGAYTEN